MIPQIRRRSCSKYWALALSCEAARVTQTVLATVPLGSHDLIIVGTVSWATRQVTNLMSKQSFRNIILYMAVSFENRSKKWNIMFTYSYLFGIKHTDPGALTPVKNKSAQNIVSTYISHYDNCWYFGWYLFHKAYMHFWRHMQLTP